MEPLELILPHTHDPAHTTDLDEEDPTDFDYDNSGYAIDNEIYGPVELALLGPQPKHPEFDEKKYTDVENFREEGRLRKMHEDGDGGILDNLARSTTPPLPPSPSKESEEDYRVEGQHSSSTGNKGKGKATEEEASKQEEASAAGMPIPDVSEPAVTHNPNQPEERDEEYEQAQSEEEVKEGWGNPLLGARLLHPTTLPLEDYPLPVRGYHAALINAYRKTQSVKRYLVALLIYLFLGIAPHIAEQNQVPRWRCYAPCDEEVIGWFCSYYNRHYRDRDNCHICGEDIERHLWRAGMNSRLDEERDKRRRKNKKDDEWEKKYDDWIEKIEEYEFKECCQGWYRCLECGTPAATELKALREDAADLGYSCKPCAEKDLDMEEQVLIQNLRKHRRKRLEQSGFKFRGHVVEELPKVREKRLMKTLKERQVEPGFIRRRDAKDFSEVCWCPGHACDSWGVELRTWKTDTHWPCPGPPHLDSDERVNPHMVDFENERDRKKLWRRCREILRRDSGRSQGYLSCLKVFHG